jgi:hypothetical protein
MTQDSFANYAQLFTGRATDFSRALLAVIAEEVRTWDVFRWGVIVLLALNLLFLLSVVGGIRSEVAALKQEQSTGTDQLARVTKEIADTRASLTLAISDTRTGLQGDIAKVNTQVNARLQEAATASASAPRASPLPVASPKPSAKPRLR